MVKLRKYQNKDNEKKKNKNQLKTSEEIKSSEPTKPAEDLQLYQSQAQIEQSKTTLMRSQINEGVNSLKQILDSKKVLS